MIEQWKSIKDFEDLYEISTFGRVKALKKKVYYIDGRIRNYEEKILKPRIDGRGYYFVTLHGKTIEQLRVHRLVSEAFIDNSNNKPCVNHKDSNRLNNRVDNLEWCTYSENTVHGIRAGNINNPAKKISAETAIQIREYKKNNTITQASLGKLFGLGQSQIYRILSNKNWKELTHLKN